MNHIYIDFRLPKHVLHGARESIVWPGPLVGRWPNLDSYFRWLNLYFWWLALHFCWFIGQPDIFGGKNQ